MTGQFRNSLALAVALAVFAGPALAQRGGPDDATNQDDPVRIIPCVWLSTPRDDTSALILGTAWVGRGQDMAATRKKAAACVHLAPDAVALPAPCPGGMIGVMSDQHYTPC